MTSLGDEGQGEEAEDDGGNPGQDLKHRLHDASQPGRRILAQEDRRQQAGGRAMRAPPNRHEQSPASKRQYPEVLRLKLRRPLRVGQELDDRDLAEEADRLLQESGDYREQSSGWRRRRRERGRLDCALAPVAQACFQRVAPS